jgi:hypothetical protein
MPGVREVSSLLGDLMLKGWTMLADRWARMHPEGA